jgi:hypothetical protein
MIQAIMLVCSLAIPREHCVDNTADYYTQMLGDWKNPYACQFEAQARLADDVNKGLVTIDPTKQYVVVRCTRSGKSNIG